jgi:hypothetical protein
MGKHSSAEKASAFQHAQIEARRRAVSVARFGLVIAVSVTLALLLFGGHRLPLQ